MKDIKITDVRHHTGDSAFLIDDGKTAVLYDTGFAFTGENIAKKISGILGNRPLDYIFLTHSHYDHAAGAPYIKRAFPNVQIVAGEYAAKIFAKPTARAVMRDLDRKFAKINGIDDYPDLFDELRADITVCDGDIIRAGDMEFTAISLPGHTRCSFGFYLAENGLLLGSETLGVYAGNGVVIPSYLIGYDTTIESLEKAEKMHINNLLAPHYGVLDTSETYDFFENAKRSAVDVAQEIAAILKNGGSHDDAFEFFKEKFYHGDIKITYPPDAMELNTRITIKLIEKEFVLTE